MSVELVATGVKCSIGEGPHWEDDKQSLLFVDSTEGDIFRWFPESKDLQKINLGNTVGSVVPCKDGGYLVGLGRAISHLDWETQRITKQLEVESVGADDRLNDGKCDASGRFWTGTMGKQLTDIPTYELNVGVLYSFGLDGFLNRYLDKLQVSNGMIWTKDNRTMFYTDSVPQKIYAFDYDINLGTISKRLQTVHVPAKRSTSCCFGGKNLDELYITSANHCAGPKELQAYPESGSLFKVTGLGVKGYPANIYKGKLQNL